MKPALCILLVCLLPACTTLKMYQKWSPQERAQKTCQRDKTITSEINAAGNLKAAIRQSDIALSRGYRLHQECHQVEVQGNATVTCNKYGTMVQCNENRPTYYRTECTDIPVPINPQLEQSNNANWRQQLSDTENQIRKDIAACRHFILNQPVNQAYQYYRNREVPF